MVHEPPQIELWRDMEFWSFRKTWKNVSKGAMWRFLDYHVACSYSSYSDVAPLLGFHVVGHKGHVVGWCVIHTVDVAGWHQHLYDNWQDWTMTNKDRGEEQKKSSCLHLFKNARFTKKWVIFSLFLSKDLIFFIISLPYMDKNISLVSSKVIIFGVDWSRV